jgi:GT2 family glycosyltransferase
MRVAAFITNYNMPERADALAEHLKTYPNVDLYLVDNGSDLVPPAKHTNIFIEKNVQTTAGWMRAYRKAQGKYDAYWFLITSAEFVQDGVLPSLVEVLEKNPDAVGVHPALTHDSTSTWSQLFWSGGHEPRPVAMIDNIASLWRADWFDSIGGFDQRFIYGWGVDLETCYFARRDRKSIWVDDRVQMRKITDIGYEMERMNMTASERKEKARENMKQVMAEKYGPVWRETILAPATDERRQHANRN